MKKQFGSFLNDCDMKVNWQGQRINDIRMAAQQQEQRYQKQIKKMMLGNGCKTPLIKAKTPSESVAGELSKLPTQSANDKNIFSLRYAYIKMQSVEAKNKILRKLENHSNKVSNFVDDKQKVQCFVQEMLLDSSSSQLKQNPSQVSILILKRKKNEQQGLLKPNINATNQQPKSIATSNANSIPCTPGSSLNKTRSCQRLIPNLLSSRNIFQQKYFMKKSPPGSNLGSQRDLHPEPSVCAKEAKRAPAISLNKQKENLGYSKKCSGQSSSRNKLQADDNRGNLFMVTNFCYSNIQDTFLTDAQNRAQTNKRNASQTKLQPILLSNLASSKCIEVAQPQ